MTNLRSYLIAAIIGISALSAVAPNANACGFIGCIVNQVVPGAGDQLDQLNRDLGHPAEQVLDGALDYYVPGAGEAARIYQNSR